MPNQKPKKNHSRRLLRLLAVVIALGSAFLFLRTRLDKDQGADAYASALDIATSSETRTVDPKAPTAPIISETVPGEKERVYLTPQPIEEEDPSLEKLKQIDVRALQEVNPDVLGWIYIPNTVINYPLLQGEDNDFYLNNTWKGQPNAVGSIFLEHQNNPNFLDYNTIIYGHNMNDGSMFGPVARYPQQWFYNAHPHVYIVLPDYILRYDVFAAYQAELEDMAYALTFHEEQTRLNFVAQALQKSTIQTDIVPDPSDLILTLSTCVSGNHKYRYVAHARLKLIPIEE